MSMDRVSRAFYEYRYELAFLKKRGLEFQDFFSEIMERRYPGDFQRVRPWGNAGDRKNDGYCRSLRRLYGVYAPNEMSATEAVAKIDGDFRGALPHWEQYFSTWVFVHNSRDGLGPHVSEKLLALEVEHKQIALTNCGFQELFDIVFELPTQHLASLFGPALTQRDILSVGIDDLYAVLTIIALSTAPLDPDLRPVPPNKVEHNRLSASVEALLNAGRMRASLVQRLLQSGLDPAIGDKIATALRERYVQLRDMGLAPDLIFEELQVFAGGPMLGQPGHQAAVLAVLAYFFDECDIFERPGEALSA